MRSSTECSAKPARGFLTADMLGPLILLLLATCLSGMVQAQEEDPDDEYRAGLVGTFTPQHAPSFIRIDRQLGFDATSWLLDERLGKRSFRARWSGLLETDAAGPHYFAAYLCGSIRIRVGNQVVLDAERPQPGWVIGPAVDLPVDSIETRIDYRSPADGGQARLRLYWQGPGYELEPIPGRVWSHPVDTDGASDGTWHDRGRDEWTAHHCAACHGGPALPQLPVPDLSHAASVLRPDWIVARLTQGPARHDTTRRMPYYQLPQDQARQIVTYLWHQSKPLPAARPQWLETPPARPSSARKRKGKTNGEKAKGRQTANRRVEGKRLVFTLGCLACHAYGDAGHPTLFGGPDLKQIAAKRPASFITRWLGDPASIQPRHAMPRFPLTQREADAIRRFLASPTGERPTANDPARAARSPASRSAAGPTAWRPSTDPAEIEAGRRLFQSLGCAACHRLNGAASDDSPRTERPTIVTDAWQRASWHGSDQAPFHFVRPPASRRALAAFGKATLGKGTFGKGDRQETPSDAATPLPVASLVLRQYNCLTCHRRASRPGLAAIAADLLGKAGLSGFDPARLVPPSLDSIGHKYLRERLVQTIAGGSSRRPYLSIRMPHFGAPTGGKPARQLDVPHVLASYFAALDDIPEPAPHVRRPQPVELDQVTLRLVGSRLVTTDGFGCTSCHALGGVDPPPGPINARGPDLTQPGKRMRRSWFIRWVHNPTRIVPRMEMPGVKIPVRGLLDEQLDRQLAALWRVLNEPGFRPPRPNPVRTVRQTGIASTDAAPGRAIFITDVVHHEQDVFVKPLLVGLANRHSILFDLASGRLVLWMTGDLARQRTEGKTWFWEAAGTPVWQASDDTPELELVRDGRQAAPQRAGQFVTEFDEVRHRPDMGGLEFTYRLRFAIDSHVHTIRVTQSWSLPADGDLTRGFRRSVMVRGIPPGWEARFRPLLPSASSGRQGPRVDVESPGAAARPAAAGEWRLTEGEPAEFIYRTTAHVDRFPASAGELPAGEQVEWDLLPGFRVRRLPLPTEMMPTNFAWLDDGTLAITSLKGRVWLARDVDGDGLAETARPASDELAAPYGAHGGPGYLDVINKYALLRLVDEDHDGRFDRYIRLASGWGHTTDYHDWAVGLPRDTEGNYYVALPCQQDDRSRAAARLRGSVLRLVPRRPTADDPSRFAIDRLSGGHRFPMGLALSRFGRLYATDNQGNYNPFNELNHVQRGKRYGFYNKLEKQAGLKFPTTPPAIKIPHPWTRSVNGICFLYDPTGSKRFGPFEGHLVGCEMNSKKLIRMTLEEVDGVMQGAAYPFSREADEKHPAWVGPLACAVSPNGDLFIGSLIDSGWGGGNNMGEVVRCEPRMGRLPAGIREVRIRPHGFRIALTAPVDRQRAADTSRYTLRSYTRVSTPAYGGPDVQRRHEPLDMIRVSGDGKLIELRLRNDLRPGFVYEIHLRSLVPEGSEFFPAEAHYTVNRIPRR